MKFSGCIIDLTYRGFPLVMHDARKSLLWPTSQDTIYVKKLDTVKFVCPESTVVLQGEDTGKTIVSATCFPDATSSSKYRQRDIRCKNFRIFSVRSTKTDTICAIHSFYILFFIHLPNKQKLHLFAVCFQKEKSISLFGSYVLHPIFFEKDLVYDTLSVRPNAVKLDLRQYHVGYDPLYLKIYKKNIQRQTINELYGLHPNSSKYIKFDSPHFLAMTYLVPPWVFYHKQIQQNAVRFINMVPQWEIIKQGNWLNLEREIRHYVMRTKEKINVYTGIFGSVVLNHTTFDLSVTKPTVLYLHKTENRFNHYPVAAMLWKLLYNVRLKKAVVFIMHNNPYLERPSPLCSDVSDIGNWMQKWNRHNISAGYSYTCPYYEFRRKCAYVPMLPVRELLRAI